MRTWLLFSSLTFSIAIPGCSSGDIARSRAERLINAHETASFTKDRPLTVPLGTDGTINAGVRAGLWKRCKFKSDGATPRDDTPPVELTTAGRRIFTGIAFRDFEWSALAPDVERQVVSVEGITAPSVYHPGKELKQVDFTWQWKSGPVVDAMRSLGRMKDTHKGMALLRKFSDGWRIAYLKWSGTEDWLYEQHSDIMRIASSTG